MSTINVNLAQCTCGGRSKDGQPFWSSGEHHSMCHATPINIPCRLPPSVTFEVVLGECISPAACGLFSKAHLPDCPARPIRVTCSISGETWEESHPSSWETEDGIGLNTTEEARAADDRWALVKALVLGHSDLSALITGPMAADLLTQRYAVYAALADMARAEEATLAARDALHRGMGLPLSRRLAPELRESAVELGVYVERLIEQVGGMT